MSSYILARCKNSKISSNSFQLVNVMTIWENKSYFSRHLELITNTQKYPQGIIKNQYEPAFYLQGSPCRKSIFHLLNFCISRAIALVLLLNGTFSGTSRHITGVFWVFRSHSGVSRWVACVYLPSNQF